MAEEYSTAQIWTLPVYVQGDIQPIIRLLAHHGRMKRQDLVNVLTDSTVPPPSFAVLTTRS